MSFFWPGEDVAPSIALRSQDVSSTAKELRVPRRIVAVMTDAGVPEAWPALMSREQLRAYLGGICDATLRKVCPVPPIDLGANVLRYRKMDVDGWLAATPCRLPRPKDGEQDAPPADVANDRPTTAVERARARAAGKR